MSLPITIGIAIIAFLIVVCIIFFSEIKKYILGKLKFKKKSAKKAEEKPKQKAEKASYTVEDFKPIAKNHDEDIRDSSIESLFAFEEYPTIKEELKKPSESILTDSDRKKLDDFFSKDKTAFKRINNNVKSESKSTISKQIKNLSPEMKALLVDNVLKKRDDV